MANKIILCQTGARHRYLIPQVLEQSEMLYRLYTDTTAYSSLGKFASFLNKYFRAPNSVKRLTRRIPNIPLNKLFTTDRLFVKKLIKGLFKKDSLSLRFLHYTGFAKKCIAWGVGNADILSQHIDVWLMQAKKEETLWGWLDKDSKIKRLILKNNKGLVSSRLFEMYLTYFNYIYECGWKKHCGKNLPMPKKPGIIYHVIYLILKLRLGLPKKLRKVSSIK